MKRIALPVLLASFAALNVFANETVTLAIGEWPPYTSATDVRGNFLEKIVTEAFKSEGIGVKYYYYPWKRSYEIVKSGKYDGTFPWNKTDERDKDFHINKISLIKDESVFFHLKSKQFDWGTIEDLKNYKVGVTIGYKQEQIYKEKGIEAEAVRSDELNFRKILAGRIDVHQTSKDVGYATINKIFSPEQAALFTNHPKAVEENEYFILFSKNTENGKKLADIFDAGIKKLIESGTYDKIITEHRTPKIN
jgi:polar amino acid transport system substrate-binding protein